MSSFKSSCQFSHEVYNDKIKNRLTMISGRVAITSNCLGRKLRYSKWTLKLSGTLPDINGRLSSTPTMRALWMGLQAASWVSIRLGSNNSCGLQVYTSKLSIESCAIWKSSYFQSSAATHNGLRHQSFIVRHGQGDNGRPLINWL